jgi:hypothetical protein
MRRAAAAAFVRSETCITPQLRAVRRHVAATGFRLAAKTISDPRLRQPVQQRAQCAAALAETFEKARKARLNDRASADFESWG